jgi:acyl-coenzyme A synthetase/AMP-(fatty) acid ligase
MSYQLFIKQFTEIISLNEEKEALLVINNPNHISISYKKLNKIVNNIIGFFLEKKLDDGNIILSLLPNSAENLLCFLATMKAGFGFAPLSYQASLREVENWVNQVQPKIILIPSNCSVEILNYLNQLNVMLVSIEMDTLFKWIPHDEYCFSLLPNDHLTSRLYLCTSGTTGTPKVMAIDSHILWLSGYQFMKFHHLNEEKIRIWNYLPMSYLGGLYNLGLIPLSCGGSIIIDDLFSAKTLLNYWSTVVKYSINTLWLVPTILRGLNSLAERISPENRSLFGTIVKNVFIGTSPVTLAEKLQFEKFFHLKVLENFALSETIFFASETKENILFRSEGSVGEILDYVDCKLNPIEVDGEGYFEIMVKSPFLFLGYLGSDGSIKKVLDQDGYFATGDLGHFNENKILVIDGRKRDVIKVGGHLVAIREIEVFMEQHPFVQEAAGVKIPHQYYGESFNLFLMIKDKAKSLDQVVLKNEFKQFICNNFVKYKWPERIEIVEFFPRTASGKLRKHELVL